jgi:maleate isomerase
MEISPVEVYDWSKEHVSNEAEAVFIGGNGMRTIGAIQALEEALALPVLTANQVSMWQALRVVGIRATLREYGRILGVADGA